MHLGALFREENVVADGYPETLRCCFFFFFELVVYCQQLSLQDIVGYCMELYYGTTVLLDNPGVYITECIGRRGNGM